MQFYLKFIYVDNHHVDDEEEAVQFINQNTNNSTAFLMHVAVDELEQDCSKLVGSSTLHEFRYFLFTFMIPMFTIFKQDSKEERVK